MATKVKAKKVFVVSYRYRATSDETAPTTYSEDVKAMSAREALTLFVRKHDLESDDQVVIVGVRDADKEGLAVEDLVTA